MSKTKAMFYDQFMLIHRRRPFKIFDADAMVRKKSV